MRPLRAFLLLRSARGDWDISVHRDLESIQEAWKARSDVTSSAALHVGFWRPAAEAFGEALSAWPGRLLLSASTGYSLPSGFAASVLPVGEASGLPLHIALSGWGYEIQDPSQAPTFLQATKSLSATLGSFSDWCSALPSNDPELATAALVAGVTDEASYLAAEPSLPFGLRDRLGRFRFLRLSGYAEPEATHILDVLKLAPPWLLALPITRLNFSTRVCNVLAAESVATIGDLAPHGSAGVLGFVNLGRKSYSEICERIVSAFRYANASAPHEIFLQREAGPRAASDEMPPAEKQTDPRGEDASGPAASPSLKAALDAVLSILKPNEQRIMAMRMGMGRPAATLQEIGDVEGLTRERIRQIESRALLRIKSLPYWNADLARRLDAILDERVDGLPLEGLEILDPWFSGAADTGSAFGYVAEHLPDTPFHLVREGPMTFVSRASQQEWLDAIAASRRLLAGLVGRRTSLVDARALVDGLLTGRGEELRPELWYSASRHAHFSDDGSGPILVSCGWGVEHLVKAQLAASDRPLHYTEIHARLTASRESCDIRRVHNAAATVGLLYARGVYGAERHYPLDDEEAKLLVSETEDIVECYGPGRQWHAREICDVLEERGLDFGGRLDPYVVSIALRRSSHMTYLGRMVWASSASGVKGTANRLDVHQAIVSILKGAGGPLSSDEVRMRLSRERGLNCYFQIQPEGSVVRVGVGMWGLMARDLPFSENEVSDVLREIRRILSERCKGLHVSEILDAVLPRVPAAANVADPALFIGLAQKSAGFSVAKGQYLYLSEWGESRRVTISEAVLCVLRAAGPMGISSEEGIHRVEALIERPYSRVLYGQSCRSVGALYSEAMGRWYIPAQDDERDEEDPDDSCEAA